MGNAKREESTATTTRVRPWLFVSTAAIGWGIFTLIVLHIVSAHNPALDTLSSYAFTNRGTGMLEVSVLSLAIGSFALLGALHAAEIPTSRTTTVLFANWGLGLVTAAVFPASYITNPHPVSGEIHQYSCMIAFLSMPGIGFSVLDKVRGTPALESSCVTLARFSRYSAGGLALFGMSYLLADFPHVPVMSALATALPIGVTQRIAVATDIVLLYGLLLLASRTASLREHTR